jgi:hypothetical protein
MIRSVFPFAATAEMIGIRKNMDNKRKKTKRQRKTITLLLVGVIKKSRNLVKTNKDSEAENTTAYRDDQRQSPENRSANRFLFLFAFCCEEFIDAIITFPNPEASHCEFTPKHPVFSP